MTAASVFWVALGGAVGAWLRVELSDRITSQLGKGFPYGTLSVNVLGSFVMGLLIGAVTVHLIPPDPWRNLIGEGLLGAFTTFSTFSMDTYKLFHAGSPGKGVLNAIVNMVLPLGGVAVGYHLIA